MRFLLPFVSVCVLAPAGNQLANAATPEKSNQPPVNGKKQPASFFLEEITPGTAATKATPAKGKVETKAATKPAAQPAKTKETKPGILESAQTQAPGKHFQQGLMMQSMGMHANAIAEYKDALKEDPKFISTYNNLAQCYVYRNDPGDKEEALKLMTEAQKIAPTNVGTLHALAVLKESNKDYAGAQDAYKKVLAVQPLNQRAIQNLAEIYYRLGEKEKARAVILEAMKHNPPDQQATVFKAALVNLDKDPKELAKENEKAAADAKKQAEAERQATEKQIAETRAAMEQQAASAKAAKTAPPKTAAKDNTK